MPGGVSQRSAGRFAAPAVRVLALGAVFLAAAYIINAVLIFWFGWPGVRPVLSGSLTALGLTQAGLYVLAAAAPVAYAAFRPERGLEDDAAMLSSAAGFIIRWAFWAVLLVGLVDAVISFLRVEGLLGAVFGETLAGDLGRSRFRGVWVHCPLLVISGLVALRVRALGFPWLALLIVFAEIQIVIARFVFSYEQAFMADLVRFWYAGLFLFASPYTLLTNGHVRVDVLYAGFGARAKARTNAVGAAVLGFPFCWVIITSGMGGARSIITGPLLGFEVSQAGYGMYVKYLLAGYLLVFAAAMLVQFASMLLSSAAVLLSGEEPEDAGPHRRRGAAFPAPEAG